MKTSNRIKSCAGCRALFKETNNNHPFVFCYLNKPMQKTDIGVLDKRLDFEVFRKPVERCKVITNIQLAKASIERNNNLK